MNLSEGAGLSVGATAESPIALPQLANRTLIQGATESLMARVRSGLANIARSRERVEAQMDILRQSRAKLDQIAQQAAAIGRPDLANDAIARRATIHAQVSALETEYGQLRAKEEEARARVTRLQAKVDAMIIPQLPPDATAIAADLDQPNGQVQPDVQPVGKHARH